MTGTPPRGAPAPGFTLMETMVTLVIIAILARIAMPIYINQVMESRRVDAKNALLDLASREEKYYATNNSYSSNFAATGGLGYTGATSTTTTVNVGTTGSSTYQLSITLTNSNTNYSLLATPVNAQASDACGAYVLTDSGAQSNQTTGSSPTTITGQNCW